MRHIIFPLFTGAMIFSCEEITMQTSTNIIVEGRVTKNPKHVEFQIRNLGEGSEPLIFENIEIIDHSSSYLLVLDPIDSLYRLETSEDGFTLSDPSFNLELEDRLVTATIELPEIVLFEPLSDTIFVIIDESTDENPGSINEIQRLNWILSTQNTLVDIRITCISQNPEPIFGSPPPPLTSFEEALNLSFSVKSLLQLGYFGDYQAILTAYNDDYFKFIQSIEGTADLNSFTLTSPFSNVNNAEGIVAGFTTDTLNFSVVKVE